MHACRWDHHWLLWSLQITKYDSLKGYLFNIAFLKNAFDPHFYCHDIWASDEVTVTSRWTMEMTLAIPLLNIKRPLSFTGTSAYVFDPDSGRIIMQIYKWDSIDNQEFFSIEVGGW